MSVASFGPTATTFITATATTSEIAIPTTGTPTVALLTNLSTTPVYVEMGTSSSVVATVQGSFPIMPGQQFALTIGSNTNIAVITGAGYAGVNVTVGS